MPHPHPPLTKESLAIINKAFRLASSIWGMGANMASVRVMIGNYSGYGRYLTRYKVETRLIEIPLNESYSFLEVTKSGIVPKNPKRLLGVILRELGHHVEQYHPDEPWRGVIAGQAPYTTPAWCWICAKGWDHFFPHHRITPIELGMAVRSFEDAAYYLAKFEPNRDPASFLARIREFSRNRVSLCENCGTPFPGGQGQYCSSRCRSAAHLSSKNKPPDDVYTPASIATAATPWDPSSPLLRDWK